MREADEGLTSAQAGRALIKGGLRRERPKEKTESVAATILLQSHLDTQG